MPHAQLHRQQRRELRQVFNAAEDEPPPSRKHYWAPAPVVEHAPFGKEHQTLYVTIQEATELVNE